MMDDLLNFDYIKSQYDGGSDIPRSHATQRSAISDVQDIKDPKNLFEDDYIVLDQKKVPQNMIE